MSWNTNQVPFLRNSTFEAFWLNGLNFPPPLGHQSCTSTLLLMFFLLHSQSSHVVLSMCTSSEKWPLLVSGSDYSPAPVSRDQGGPKEMATIKPWGMPWAGSPEPSPSSFTTCPGVTGLIPLLYMSVLKPEKKLSAFSKQIYQACSNDIQSHGNKNLLFTPKFEQQQGRWDSFRTYLSLLAARALQLGATRQRSWLWVVGECQISENKKGTLSLVSFHQCKCMS